MSARCFLRWLALCVAVDALCVAAADPTSGRGASTNLRGEATAAEATARPVRELSAVWTSADAGFQAQLQPIEKLVGGDAIVVFNDRAAGADAQSESAVVSFDVRSSANCAVSVCGTQRKWYMGSREQCFDLRVAAKSGDAIENGLIRGISAAYVGSKPVADKLYLKFDATNFIDGSPCEYEIVSGVKTLRKDEAALGGSVAGNGQ